MFAGGATWPKVAESLKGENLEHVRHQSRYQQMAYSLLTSTPMREAAPTSTASRWSCGGSTGRRWSAQSTLAARGGSWKRRPRSGVTVVWDEFAAWVEGEEEARRGRTFTITTGAGRSCCRGSTGTLSTVGRVDLEGERGMLDDTLSSYA